jgi:EAL and modified HD-GYP domain-containing signal transduction protein
MDVFVARQAILTRHKDVYGYELLFRSDPAVNSFDRTDSSSATRQVIANTLFSAGLEGILCGKRAFINFDRKMLLDGSCTILPKETLVVEVLETVEPDDEVLAACARLSESGYAIALDDFVHAPKFERLIENVRFIKVDLRSTGRAEQKRLVRTYGRQGVRMLAEKVETLEEFEWARSIGFDYFQGYFFTKPAILRGRQIPVSKFSCLRLLQEAQEREIDFGKLCELIKDDVSFSYKLLHYTNSALFSRQSEIRTIDRALMVLGEDGIRRWAAMAALPGLASDKPHELIVQSLLRAQFAERLGRAAGMETAPQCFMMGLFSLIDALLDRSLEYALGQIKLAPPVEQVLLGTADPDSRMAAAYELIRGYEEGDWRTVTELAGRLGLHPAQAGEIYVESAQWVSEALGALL